MNRSVKSEVIVYHDETGREIPQNIKGHILLFVPLKTTIEYERGLFNNQSIIFSPHKSLFEDIKKIREDCRADHKFHFTDISGRKWTNRNEAEKRLIGKAVELLRQKGINNNLFCKIGIILYQNPTSNHVSAYGGESRNEKRFRFGETLLRMLLKGAVHCLYDTSHRVKILKIFTDGQAYHRKLGNCRILNRLMNELREYVEICEQAEIVHLPSHHKKHLEKSEDFIHANMLQLADMLLGSAVYACFGNAAISEINPRINDCVTSKKGIVACAMKKMMDKRKRGRNFQNSSHYKAFTISKAIIKNDDWTFENVVSKEIQIDQDNGQINLFDSYKVYNCK